MTDRIELFYKKGSAKAKTTPKTKYAKTSLFSWKTNYRQNTPPTKNGETSILNFMADQDYA
jgi:hypothetical protein